MLKYTRIRKHERVRPLYPVTVPVLSMILCLFCLAGSSWAWFTAAQTAGVAEIRSGVYRIDQIDIEDLGRSVVPDAEGAQNVDATELEPGHDYEFTTKANTRYAVTLTIAGETSGYIAVQAADGTTWYSDDTDGDFILLPDELQAGTIRIGASWGKPEAGIMLIDDEEGDLDLNWFVSGDVLGDGALCSCEIWGEDCGGCDLCAIESDDCLGDYVCLCDIRCDGCAYCDAFGDVCEGTPVCSCETLCDGIDTACSVCLSGGACVGAAPVDPVLPEIPEVTLPEPPVIPEITIPEPVLPEIPEITIPEPVIPEPPVIEPPVAPEVPEITPPEVTVPEVTVPEVTVPEVTVPEVTVPEVTIPDPQPVETPTEPEPTDPV